MARGYDKLGLNYRLLLGLPFREGVGVITRDMAMPHHPMTLNDPGGGSFIWGNLATGIPYLQYITVGGGATDGVYIDSPAAATGDLDFTTEDYSIGCWINWTDSGQSEMIAGRYFLDTDGWELYLYVGGAGQNYLTLRHHHGSLGTVRTACNSQDWTPGIWWFMGVSRIGGYPLHYRNARLLDMDYSVGGILDPDSAVRDLVLGARHTKNADWYNGMMWYLRIWGRALSQEEWFMAFEMERAYFGV